MTEERPEPKWLSWQILRAIHFDQCLQHGGAQGVRNIGLVESALARPRNKWHYEKAGIFVLAAAYGYGIAKNHGFEDGNKRTAFLALYTYLGLNGFDLEAPEEDVVQVMTAVADGTLDEEGLANWIRSRSQELT